MNHHPELPRVKKRELIVLFDLTLLVYWWTSPSEKWKSRRNNWKSLLMLALFSVILVIACVLIFV
jgi:hypothetical protein